MGLARRGRALGAVDGDDPQQHRRRPRWLPDAPVHAPPSFQVQAAPTPALQDLAGTWQAPLFSPDRRPDREVGKTQVASLANLTLSGIMITGNLQMAMLKQAGGPTLTVRLGQALPNGWRLEHLTPQYARFALDGRTQTLSLYGKRLPLISHPRESLP